VEEPRDVADEVNYETFLLIWYSS